MVEAKQRAGPFIVYLILFFAVWTGWVYLGYPHLRNLGETTLAYALVNIAVRFIVWVCPVWWYLRYVDRVGALAYLKLRQHWQRGLIIGLLLSVVNFLGACARFGPPTPSMQYVTWNSILSTSLTIGLLEEIPFRGFMLQKIEARTGFWLANLISSLLFLAIHLPGWISLHVLHAATALSVFCFGVLLAVVLRYSKSLWSCIVAHSLNDLIAFVLFHL